MNQIKSSKSTSITQECPRDIANQSRQRAKGGRTKYKRTCVYQGLISRQSTSRTKFQKSLESLMSLRQTSLRDLQGNIGIPMWDSTLCFCTMLLFQLYSFRLVREIWSPFIFYACDSILGKSGALVCSTFKSQRLFVYMFVEVQVRQFAVFVFFNQTVILGRIHSFLSPNPPIFCGSSNPIPTTSRHNPLLVNARGNQSLLPCATLQFCGLRF